MMATSHLPKRSVYAVRRLSTHLPARLLDDLAVVDRAPAALAVRDIARVVADDVVGISVAFLICGSTPTPAELRAASAPFATDVSVIVVVCDPDAVPGFRRVSGLTVLTIGYLEELRAALSRTAAVA